MSMMTAGERPPCSADDSHQSAYTADQAWALAAVLENSAEATKQGAYLCGGGLGVFLCRLDLAFAFGHYRSFKLFLLCCSCCQGLLQCVELGSIIVMQQQA